MLKVVGLVHAESRELAVSRGLQVIAMTLDEVSAKPLTYRGEPHVLYAARDITERRDAEARRTELELRPAPDASAEELQAAARHLERDLRDPRPRNERDRRGGLQPLRRVARV